jgi:hypothetical protein
VRALLLSLMHAQQVQVRPILMALCSKVNPVFRKRWFVLEHGLLKYYEHEPDDYDMEPRGWLALEDCVLEEDPDRGKGGRMRFAVKGTAARRMICEVESENERSEWVTAIKSALNSIGKHEADTGAFFRLYLEKHSRNVFLRASDGNAASAWINAVSGEDMLTDDHVSSACLDGILCCAD